MKLTIIPSDRTVYVDEKAISDLTWSGTPVDVHALQWLDVAGFIEFDDKTKPNEEIAVLPDWANNAYAAWVTADTAPKPVPTADQNKQTAVFLLQDTDWATIPDVANPAVSNPYLVNASDFVLYRNLIRGIAVNPVAGELQWPVAPVAVWGSV